MANVSPSTDRRGKTYLVIMVIFLDSFGRCATLQRAGSGGGGARAVLNLDDPAVIHAGDPVAEVKDAVIVGDDHNSAVGPDGRLAEQIHHRQSGLMVKCGRGLVANQEPRVVHQCSGNGDPLLLTTGELAGQALGPLAHPQRFEDKSSALDGLRSPSSRQ